MASPCHLVSLPRPQSCPCVCRLLPCQLVHLPAGAPPPGGKECSECAVAPSTNSGSDGAVAGTLARAVAPSSCSGSDGAVAGALSCAVAPSSSSGTDGAVAGTLVSIYPASYCVSVQMQSMHLQHAHTHALAQHTCAVLLSNNTAVAVATAGELPSRCVIRYSNLLIISRRGALRSSSVVPRRLAFS